MFTLYNVISKDGFIARKDGSEDFIPDTLWQNFLDICLEYGTLVMGRKTYDVLQSYDDDLLVTFEKLPIKKMVITTDHSFSPKSGYTVANSPKDISESSPRALVVSGPTLNNFLLGEGMVDKVIHHEVPVSIGEGIKPFDEDLVTLIPVQNTQKLDGVEVREYQVGEQSAVGDFK
jgi:dihydrofolate reductase